MNKWKKKNCQIIIKILKIYDMSVYLLLVDEDDEHLHFISIENKREIRTFK